MAFVALVLPVPGYNLVPKPKLKEGEAVAPPDNTGVYGGWWIRVKGDGRVEARDDNGHATIHHDVIEAKHWIDTYGPPENPVGPPIQGPAPTISALSPAEAVVGDPDFTMTVTGTGFALGTTIVFNGSNEVTDVLSDTECSTIVQPSTASGAATVPISVRNADGQTSNELDFSFTDPAEDMFA
jgi:hypothetical protein